MRRFLTIALLITALAWSSPVSAIKPMAADKDAKQTEAEPAAETKPQASPGTTNAKSSSQSTEKSKSTMLNNLKRQLTESKAKPQKHDIFKDNNKDGVSDDVRKRPATEGGAAAAPKAADRDVAKPQEKTTKTPPSTEKKKPNNR